MSESKTLKELGEEYLEYLKLNEQNVASCKAKLKIAKEKGDSFAELELQKSLKILYEISRELKENSARLIKYYG